MLRLPSLDVVKPQSLAAALMTLGAEPEVKVLAGGTDLVVALKYGLNSERTLLSLEKVPLSYIRYREGMVEVGATTTLWDLCRHPFPGSGFAALVKAASLVAAPPIRSRATVGGNLLLDTRCHFYNQSAFWRSSRPACFKAGGDRCHAVPGSATCHACHMSDLAPVLIAMGAAVALESSNGKRLLPLEELYTGDGKKPLSLAGDELLTSVSLPLPAEGAATGFEKLRMRKGLDFAFASAAVSLARGPDGGCADSKVVLGALGSGPIRVFAAEEALNGSALGEAALEAAAEAALKAARPVKNSDLTPAYRRKMAGVAVKRAARAAWEAVS